ncbi:MAG TPA: nucleoside deaminase [Aggregatilineales bacterium]|nr:nucleoside deaminase [Anaerolineae bacterium]HUN10046.1 nucleoside deaminase [Aggregatilineales bacterium]
MQFTLTMPDWADEELRKLPDTLPTVEDRMAAVIRFSRLNIEHGTGGPFAAGVFERESGKPLMIGVNRVMAHQISSAHAEVMTLSLAQQILGTYDLGGPNLPVYQFVVNWRPCAMCFGATLWSGIRSLVIAGSGPELEQITGFDEGPVHPEWKAELAKRGIELIEDVLKEEAMAVYRQFAASQAFVYNARLGKTT